MRLVDVVLMNVIQEIDRQLSLNKKRGYVPIRGLTHEDLGEIVRVLKGLGLKAGTTQNGVWWAVKAVKKTTQTPPPETK